MIEGAELGGAQYKITKGRGRNRSAAEFSAVHINAHAGASTGVRTAGRIRPPPQRR